LCFACVVWVRLAISSWMSLWEEEFDSGHQTREQAEKCCKQYVNRPPPPVVRTWSSFTEQSPLHSNAEANSSMCNTLRDVNSLSPGRPWLIKPTKSRRCGGKPCCSSSAPNPTPLRNPSLPEASHHVVTATQSRSLASLLAEVSEFPESSPPSARKHVRSTECETPVTGTRTGRSTTLDYSSKRARRGVPASSKSSSPSDSSPSHSPPAPVASHAPSDAQACPGDSLFNEELSYTVTAVVGCPSAGSPSCSLPDPVSPPSTSPLVPAPPTAPSSTSQALLSLLSLPLHSSPSSPPSPPLRIPHSALPRTSAAMPANRLRLVAKSTPSCRRSTTAIPMASLLPVCLSAASPPALPLSPPAKAQTSPGATFPSDASPSPPPPATSLAALLTSASPPRSHEASPSPSVTATAECTSTGAVSRCGGVSPPARAVPLRVPSWTRSNDDGNCEERTIEGRRLRRTSIAGDTGGCRYQPSPVERCEQRSKQQGDMGGQ